MKKQVTLVILIALFLIMPTVNAKSMKATDYIQKIADDAGGNKNSTEVIGNTGLAYDGTVDNNLRYVGETANNYIWFNDEMWRIIGVMNNVKDSDGNKTPKIKIIRKDSIDYTPYDFKNLTTNASYRSSNNNFLGGGVNEWSESSLYRTLNPGFENNINNDYDTTTKVNNSLYWNRQSGNCLTYTNKGNWNWYNYAVVTKNCNYSQTGLKDNYKKYIANVSWNTGTLPTNYKNISINDIYSYERGEALKCTSNETTCNDTVQRKKSTVGKVGLSYPSDYLYSMNGRNDIARSTCIQQSISSLRESYYYQCGTWMYYGVTITPVYDQNYGNKYINGLEDSPVSSANYYSIRPVVYLEPSTKIVGGSGDYGSPFIINDSDYQDINNNSNIKVKSKYKGDYSIDYLTNNYNIVTFGTKNNILPSKYNNKIKNSKKGDVINFSKVEGPVLIKNNFMSSAEKCYFSTRNNNDESFIKGELGSNMLTPSKIVTNDNYVNFDKMYAQVVNEQQKLVENTDYNLIKEDITVTKPGIYMLNNTRPFSTTYNNYNGDYIDYLYKIDNPNNDYYNYNSNYDGITKNVVKNIYIDNYNPNKNYIFNIMNEYEIDNYVVNIKKSEDPAFKTIDDLVNEGNYTGNVIFNYPNARYIELNTISGTIIAPKADIYMPQLFSNKSYDDDTLLEYNTIILANSITGKNVSMKYIPHNNNQKILNTGVKEYVVEPKDYNDDLYTGNYSLKGLLENYNIISFGKKEYDSKSKFKSLEGYKKGSVGLFHIDGQFLVNGDLGLNVQAYSNVNNAMRFDLDSNLVTESYVKGNFNRGFYIKNWSFNKPSFGSRNDLLTMSDISYTSYMYGNTYSYQEGASKIEKDYINFNRLYDNVVAKQKAIKNGQDVEVKDGVAHIKTGSNYVINNINEINEIVFDDFDDNKDLITMITIKNTGDINFPKMSADTIGLIETNDYYGKKEATQVYEINRELKDYYHGNIIWNVPDATYIKLAENAPFAGHLIAPNADVESPETHFSGCFIVNSLYCEGNTEAHFYPLTASKMNESYIDKKGVLKQRTIGVNEVLREDKSIIEDVVVGDYNQYLKDKNKKAIKDIITNPATYRNLGITLIILVIVATIIKLKVYKKENN